MQILNASDLTDAVFNKLKKQGSFVYNVVDTTEEEIVVSFIGFVGDEWEGNDPRTFSKVLSENKGKRVKVQINSGGGFLDAGTHILDLLNQHDGEVITEIYGMTASAATIISQAGKRRMSKNAQMLIHHGWSITIGNVFAHNASVERLNAGDQLIYGIYADRVKDMDSIKELMSANNGDGKWINASQALEYGLIDEVFNPIESKSTNTILNTKELGLPDIQEPNPTGQIESSTEEADVTESERRSKIISTLKL